MFDEALPFWAENGLDRAYGGFLEDLTAEGAPGPAALKRVRVTARQIYVFSHADILGWRDGRALAARGVAYLQDHARTPDGGWARLLSRQGDITDATPDLYDIAFILHGLAWRVRSANDSVSRALLSETMLFIETHLKADVGYWHALPPSAPRLQNPHMHLMEACLACFDTTDDDRFMHTAETIFALFQDHFFDGYSLGETFDPHWRRLPQQTLEPGHQFEWAWLLGAFAARGGRTRVEPTMRALIDFAERHGVGENGAVFDANDETGAPVRASSRTWPNTERLKAHLALFEHTGDDTRTQIAQSVNLLMDRYLATSPRGLWIDQFDEHGAPLAAIAPASTFYHLFLAFAELLRLEQRLLEAPSFHRGDKRLQTNQREQHR
jgi:N-acylglucosamine 2-epimerase/mannose-6-phosphate isomerase